MGNSKQSKQVNTMIDKMLDLHMNYCDIIEQIDVCFPDNIYTENQVPALFLNNSNIHPGKGRSFRISDGLAAEWFAKHEKEIDWDEPLERDK